MPKSAPLARIALVAALGLFQAGAVGAGSADRPGRIGSVSTYAGVANPLKARQDSLARFGARKNAEARTALHALDFRAERRVTESRLRSRGTRGDLARYRRRVEGREQLERLRRHATLDSLDRILARDSLGPTTRRIFEDHRAELRRLERDIDQREQSTRGTLLLFNLPDFER